MKMYEGGWRLVEVDEGKWRPMEVDHGVWKYMKLMEVDEARVHNRFGGMRDVAIFCGDTRDVS